MAESFGAERRHPGMSERVQTPDGKVGFVMGAGNRFGNRGGDYMFSVYEGTGLGDPLIGRYTAHELTPV